MKTYRFQLILPLLLLPVEVFSQHPSAGSDYLNIAPFSGALAVSEASTATYTGASSLYINPALISDTPRSVVDFSYTLWISELTAQYAGIAHRNGDHTFALTIYNAESDEVLQPDESLPVPSGYLSIATGWSWRYGPLQTGLAVHYLREELMDFRANGFALSGGLAAELIAERLTAGIALLHIGRMEDLNQVENPLPTTTRAGVEITLPDIPLDLLEELPVRIRLNVDYVFPVEESLNRDYTLNDSDDPFALFGATASLGEALELRGGIRTGETERRYSFGLGLNLLPVEVRYAFIPFSTGYGNAHSIGISYHF